MINPWNKKMKSLHLDQLKTLRHNGLIITDENQLLKSLGTKHESVLLQLIAFAKSNGIRATQENIDLLHRIDNRLSSLLQGILKTIENQIKTIIANYVQLLGWTIEELKNHHLHTEQPNEEFIHPREIFYFQNMIDEKLNTKNYKSASELALNFMFGEKIAFLKILSNKTCESYFGIVDVNSFRKSLNDLKYLRNRIAHNELLLIKEKGQNRKLHETIESIHKIKTWGNYKKEIKIELDNYKKYILNNNPPKDTKIIFTKLIEYLRIHI